MPTLSEAATKNYYTKEEFAEELGTNVNNLNQIFKLGWDKKKFPKPTKIQLMKDPENAIRNLYSPEYVEIVKKAREDVIPRGKKNAKVKLTLTVKVCDEKVAELLNKKFSNEAEMTRFLQDKLIESVKPHLKALEELKKKQERELEALMNQVK